MSPDNRAVLSPVYLSTKYTYDNLTEMVKAFEGSRKGFSYARVANPTCRELELLLAKLQGEQDGRVFSSGVAAISGVLLALLKSGDHVVSFYESYLPTRKFIRENLRDFGVSHAIFSIENLDAFEKELKSEKTRLVIFEPVTNPVLKVADTKRIVDLCAQYDVISILDNTFAGLQSFKGIGVDIYIHSLTKYAEGHGDVMGGAVLTNAEMLATLSPTLIALGANLDPSAAYRVMRGLRTYHLRRERQCENALKIAAFLSTHPRVKNLRFPGLANDRFFDRAKEQLRDFGTMICFDLDGGFKELCVFQSKLKLFHLAGSLGSTSSLMAPCHLLYATDLTGEGLNISEIRDSTVRLSIGIEDSDDLIADLSRAL